MENEKLVSRLSIGLSITVFSIKLITSIFVSSLSFLTEFSDSLLDLVSVGITLFALKESKKPPDAEHMFGHSKINSLAGFVQSLLLCGLYGGIFYSSIKELFFSKEIRVENSLIGASSLSIIIIIVFFVSKTILRIGKETKNLAIIAQAKNFRTDFYRNLAVILGLILVQFNLEILDPILAGIIAIVGIYNGLIILRDSTNELIDANALTDEIIENLKGKILDMQEVSEITQFNLRTVGNEIDLILILKIKRGFNREKIDSLNFQIKNVIKGFFPSFKTNTYIEIQSTPPKNGASTPDLFKIVRNIGKRDPNLVNMHNIIIEQFHDEILIQYHVNANPNTTIQLAHNYGTMLEEGITDEVNKYYLDKKTVVISHIEPLPSQHITHSHVRIEEDTQSLKESITTIISEFTQIETTLDLSLHRISEGYSLILRITFPPHLTISEVHEITEKLENKIYTVHKNIISCLIHAEAS
jgi:cation diffusion facilitator family transporter